MEVNMMLSPWSPSQDSQSRQPTSRPSPFSSSTSTAPAAVGYFVGHGIPKSLVGLLLVVGLACRSPPLLRSAVGVDATTVASSAIPVGRRGGPPSLPPFRGFGGGIDPRSGSRSTSMVKEAAGIPSSRRRASRPIFPIANLHPALSTRGGGDASEGEEYSSEGGTIIGSDIESEDERRSDDHKEEEERDDDDDDDEERYSRQYYTLGARAHGLVRSTTVYVDGPPRSGLTYECVKNLALSGVGSIVLLTDDEDDEEEETDAGDKEEKGTLSMGELHRVYHDDRYDDLGNAYRRAARSEILAHHGGGGNVDDNDVELALEYLRRLNPSLRVSATPRSAFLSRSVDGVGGGDGPVVLLCVDRPQSTQLVLSSFCRGGRVTGSAGNDADSGNYCIPFVSVESAGVFGRVFCDFGPDFTVVDPDGETPRTTLVEGLDTLDGEYGDGDGDGDGEGVCKFTVRCLDEGEGHDVSMGDVIEFKGGNGGNGDDGDEGGLNGMKADVLRVESPYRLTVAVPRGDRGEVVNARGLTSTAATPTTFSRIKRPVRVPFLPMASALDLAKERAIDPTIGDGSPQLFAMSDLDKSFDLTRRNAVMSCFEALGDFAERYRRLPGHGGEGSSSSSERKRTRRDEAKFRKLCLRSGFFPLSDEDGTATDKTEDDDGRWRDMVHNFVGGGRAAGKLAPVQCLLGALGAQEALKASTGLYNPIRQFLLYDCDELLRLPPGDGAEEELGEHEDEHGGVCSSSPATGQDLVLGEGFTSSCLADRRIFVVGSGAIGCELLKILAAMGAATGAGGGIVLTDMDTIERSNLSRQLLFRDGDVGKFKSVAAEAAVKRFNPSVRIEAHTSKVGEGVGHTPFDDAFWSNDVDVVLNALDNVEARLYMDSKCVENGKWGMVDAGTLGSKGNVQVVVPHVSESYGSSVDPPEPAIPVCTLKNFPYEISHTIQWARDLFDGLYNRRPSQANDNAAILASAGKTRFAVSLLARLGDDAALEAAEEIGDDLASSLFDALETPECEEARVRELSIGWAIMLFEKLFVSSVRELLRQHPGDSLDEDGEPFWSGARRMPRAPTYVGSLNDGEEDESQAVINQHVIDFVRAAARLRMEMFIDPDGNDVRTLPRIEEVTDALHKMSKPPEGHDVMDIDPAETEDRLLARIESKLEGITTRSPSRPLRAVEFEKDDESNGHVAFVTAASNIRALSYGIPPADAMETRRVSGNIVPAMITTTALVSALSCIELIKLMKSAPLNLHKNAFINLALAFFAFTSPLPAEEMPGLHGRCYTLWDRIEIKEGKKSSSSGGITLRGVLQKVKRKEGGDISSLFYGPYMIYASFLHRDDEDVMGKSIWELVRDAVASGDDIDDDGLLEEGQNIEEVIAVESTAAQLEAVEDIERRRYLEFSAVVEDSESFEELELPPIRIFKYKARKRSHGPKS